MKEVLIALGWTQQPPEGGGAVRERWESLAALLSVAEDLEAGHQRLNGRFRTTPHPAGTSRPSWTGAPRRNISRPRRASRSARCTRQRAWSGTRWRCWAFTRGRCRSSSPVRPSRSMRNERLLYVGITRARRLLRISWSRTRNGNGHPRTASRFLQPVLPESLQAPARSRAAARRSRHSALSLHCRSCGRSLTDAAERKIGRHLGCPATYDERTMAMLKEWRRQEAADQKLPAYCVFTDATLIAIAEARPHNLADLIKVQGLGRTKADKYGEHVLAIIGTEADRTRSSS